MYDDDNQQYITEHVGITTEYHDILMLQQLEIGNTCNIQFQPETSKSQKTSKEQQQQQNKTWSSSQHTPHKKA